MASSYTSEANTADGRLVGGHRSVGVDEKDGEGDRGEYNG